MPDLSEGMDEIGRAVEVLRAGGLVAFPTETVYGLGADASNPDALHKVFAAKGRPPTHPLIVHLPNTARLDDWAADVPDAAGLLADAFWPGPLTMLLRRGERVSPVATGGRETVGLRVPAHEVALELLHRFGGGVAAPSANRFGEVSPTTAQHVLTDLGDAVDLVLDGGPAVVGVESTIVDLTRSSPLVLRPGAISPEDLSAALGIEVERWIGGPSGEGTDIDPEVDQVEGSAPGTLAAHYSPAATVVLVEAGALSARAVDETATGRTVGVMAPTATEGLGPEVVELEPVGDPERYAQLLYARLRQADRLGIDVLLVVPPPDEGIGVAVVDRLRRAAAGG